MTRRGMRAAFWRSEEGSSTIEFMLFMPFMFMIFFSTFELGMLMSRQVMLDRALDLTVRAVRLGLIEPVDHDTVKTAVCNNFVMNIDCNELKLEMRRIDPRNLTAIPNDADCVDREDDSIPLRQFVAGSSNQLVYLRACALFDPFIPLAGIGAEIPRQSGDAYGLVSAAAYVVEPEE